MLPPWCVCVCVCVWGGTLIFSYIRRLGPFFGLKILNFNIFEDFVDIYVWSLQNWTIVKGRFYAFQGLFLRSRYRSGNIFWVAKISNILRCLKFLIFFFFFFWGGGGGER